MIKSKGLCKQKRGDNEKRTKNYASRNEGTMKGKVFLVGAGPGDVGLLTLKGKEALEHAETVVYDSLVGEGVFRFIPQEAECIDVGKRAGNHKMEQSEINLLLLEKALEGKCVVRLKGGDPFMFGRGGEELELLAANEIPFEIVPGVTSPLAVPAYSGIPVTHRVFSSSVHIFTGHRKQGEPLQLDFEAMVRMGGTLVFLMGVSSLGEICRGLLAAGMEPQMPAAVLQQGTCAMQKKLILSLADMEKAVQRGVQAPAILVVGEVCALGNQFAWYEKLPLFGRKILVTRPRERSKVLADRLRSLGAEVLEVPTIRTERIAENRKLWQELERLIEYQYLVFTSPAGVNIFFEELRARGKDIRSLGMAQIAAIGMGTAKEVEARGLNCAWMPEIYDGEHLGILLGEVCKKGDKILIPRAAQGSRQLIQEIEKRVSVEIMDIPIYRTAYEEFPEVGDIWGQLKRREIQMAVFTSASTARGFAKAAAGIDFGQVWAVCIGAQTEAAAKELGMETVTAKAATIDSLAEACMAASVLADG